MDNRHNDDYVNFPSESYSIPGERNAPEAYTQVSVPVPAAPPEAPLTWRDAAGPALAIALSLLFWAVFSFDAIDPGFGPGLGVPVFVTAYYAALFIMLGRRPTIGGAVLMAASLILALCCFLYAHTGFTVLNCFLILLLSAMATFSLSGQSRYGVLDWPAVPQAVQLSVLALFTRIDGPFKAAGRAGKKNAGAAGRVLLAVLLSAAILGVVVALLASADMVFGSYFQGIGAWFRAHSPGEVLWKIVRTAVLALFIASGLTFIREPAPSAAEKAPFAGERHSLPFLLPALLLDIVYVIFCAVQLRYLFGGASAAAMAGGWAEYARTGFFQLVAVAAINLILCLCGTDGRRFAARGGALLRIADGVMLALTAVILASAWYRMHLYIAAYGMSVLRLMTLWGMLVILAGLLAAGWKLCRPDFSFWKVFFSFGLATWCLLCLMNPAGRVADYNVNAYLDGRLPEVDVEYLYDLTPDAAFALRRLADAEEGAGRNARVYLDRMTNEAENSPLGWTQWKLSFRNLN